MIRSALVTAVSTENCMQATGDGARPAGADSVDTAIAGYFYLDHRHDLQCGAGKEAFLRSQKIAESVSTFMRPDTRPPRQAQQDPPGDPLQQPAGERRGVQLPLFNEENVGDRPF